MLVVLVAAGLFGAIKGFAWQVASIASIVVSYFVACRFREPLSRSIVAEEPWNKFLAMLILFIGTSLVIWVGFNMIRETLDRMRLKEFDRQIGAIFGLLKGGLYCTLITLFAVTLMGETVRSKIVASKSGRFIARNLDRSESVFPPEVHEFLEPYLERFDAQFQQSEIASGGDRNSGGSVPEFAPTGGPSFGSVPTGNWAPGPAVSPQPYPVPGGTSTQTHSVGRPAGWRP